MVNRLRDRDTADDIQRLQAFLWSVGVGVLLGMFVGVLLRDKLGWPLLPSMLGASITLTGMVYGIARFTTVGAGQVAGTIHSPSGRSTPYEHAYSLAESMVAQGEYANAVTLYREYLTADPANAEASLRLARLLRDHLEEYDEAASCFRAARRHQRPSSRLELLITRELIEMALAQQDDPPRAASELARLVARFPGTPQARWASVELAEIRKTLGLR